MRAKIHEIAIMPPGFITRILAVWHRHVIVYTRHLFSNGFPPFVEPLFFLAGIGLGLGHYVGLIEGTTYINFLATGIIVPPAMFTASFECTFGTFIRLEFDKVYDGMASALGVKDLFIGEMLFAGTKALFFSSAVLSVLTVFGLITEPMAILAPIGGFLTGLMMAAISLFVTSFVKNINHYNFFFSGFLTPMFFFSGIVFPLSNLPSYLQIAAEFFPLTHSVNIVRAFCLAKLDSGLFFDFLYIILVTVGFGYLAIKRLENRIIN